MTFSISGSFPLLATWFLSPQLLGPSDSEDRPVPSPGPVFSWALPRPFPGLTGFFQILLPAPTSLPSP